MHCTLFLSYDFFPLGFSGKILTRHAKHCDLECCTLFSSLVFFHKILTNKVLMRHILIRDIQGGVL